MSNPISSNSVHSDSVGTVMGVAACTCAGRYESEPVRLKLDRNVCASGGDEGLATPVSLMKPISVNVVVPLGSPMALPGVNPAYVYA